MTENFVQSSVVKWLVYQAHPERARALMRKPGSSSGLGEGLDKRERPQDVSCCHDIYLYAQAQEGTSR